MNVAFHKTIRAARKSGAVGRILRAVGFGGILALMGLLAGLGVLRATNVFWLIPHDAPQIWVRSGCGYAEAAVRAAQHYEPDRPVYIIPVDQRSEMARNACRTTLVVLNHEGYRWLRYFPEQWLCQRFADHATAHVGEPIGLRFYANGEVICNGLCEGAFDRIGRPELQQFLTLTDSSS